MSLQVWLPLNGNLDNNGLSGAVFNSSNITYSAGKIGNGAVFNNSYIGIANTPLNTDTKEFSFAFWMKTSTPTGTMALYNGRTATGGAISIFVFGGVFRLDDGAMHTLSYTIPTNTWEHYTFTRNNSNIKLYVNGILQVTVASTDFTSTATKATIGMSSTNTVTGSGNAFAGMLNDYRIYDHCLSEKEIKELAKGLCLHYTLDGGLQESTIEYDCSGFGNNGTKTGSIATSTDTVRRSGSYTMSANTSYISTPTMNFTGATNSYTISWWSKISDMTNKMAWGFVNGNRLNVYPTGSSFCWNTGDGANNPFGVAFTGYNGNWHHYCVTGNGTSSTLYIDGVAKGNATTYKPLTGTQIIISGWDTGTSYKWTGGSISDFRIYATALSAADVKELYNTPASIDNIGNFYAPEYDDSSAPSIHKNKTYAGSAVEENSNKKASIYATKISAQNLIEN